MSHGTSHPAGGGWGPRPGPTYDPLRPRPLGALPLPELRRIVAGSVDVTAELARAAGLPEAEIRTNSPGLLLRAIESRQHAHPPARGSARRPASDHGYEKKTP